MGFEQIKVGHVGQAGAPFRHKPATSKAKRADSTTPDASCAQGSFYASPALGASVNSLDPLSCVWRPDLACLQPAPALVDIILTAPGAAAPHIHTWQGFPYAAGNYTLALLPRWWNATASQPLQLMVVPAGAPVFLSTIPAGPVFTATYAANGSAVPAAADTALKGGDSDTTTVSASSLGGVSTHRMSAGKTAAAVILPLLFVILLGLAYLKISRARGAAKRSAWSEKLDKRMSTISTDWKAITPGGAKEAVRASIAASRTSVFSFGHVRTSAVEGEPVVMGEKRGGSIEISATDLPRTSLGSGVGVGVGARRPRTQTTPPERASRAISFADAAHPRPSMGSARLSRGSRAFHTASTYEDFEGGEGEGEAPPVPALPSPVRAGAFAMAERAIEGGRVETYDRGVSAISGERGSVYAANGAGVGAAKNTGANANANAAPQYAAWSSGERVEGVDGGYGASSVSPTGRVHTISYPANPATSDSDFAADAAADASYFSPVTPGFNVGVGAGVYEPSAESAYAENTFGGYGGGGGYAYGGYGGYEQEHQGGYEQQGQGQHQGGGGGGSNEGSGSGVGSPRQIGGPLTLTPDDIRRRMAVQHAPAPGQEQWRQSVDEVFGALSLMRTGTASSPHGSNTGADGHEANDDDDSGEYLFAPVQETVFAYPGTPAAGSGFASPALPAASPFAMPMQPPTMSPDAMLRAYATKHASVSASPSPLSNTTGGAQVVSSIKGTGMRVLYQQPEDDADPARAASPSMIRAGPGARLSR